MMKVAATIPVIPSIVVEDAGGAKSPPSIKEISLTFAHVQIYAAIIQLHEPFAPEGTISLKRCMSSVNNIARIARMIVDADVRHLQILEVSPSSCPSSNRLGLSGSRTRG